MAKRQQKSGPNPSKIFVGNISYRVKERELAEFFSEFGSVAYCQVVKDHKKGWSRGIGFVTFQSVDSAELALNASEKELILDGRLMRVSRPQTTKRLRALRSSQQAAGTTDREEQDQRKIDEQFKDVSRSAASKDVQTITGVLQATDLNDQQDGLPELNDDILMHIFSYLGLKDVVKIERVCRKWYRVAGLLWKSTKTLSFRNVFSSFRGKYGSLTDNILHSVLKKGCRQLQSLDLCGSPHLLTDYALDLIGMYCPKLVKLDLSGVSVTQTSFKLLTQRCSQMKWLKMSGSHQVGEKCLWWALHNFSDLEYLNVAGNRRISGQCFHRTGSKLKTVILRDCDKLADQGLAFLLKQSPALEVLDINHCQQLTGTSIRQLSEVRMIPEIEYIEEETMATGTQVPAPIWHLDRLDERALPLDLSYQPVGSGEGVDIYILDTGVNYQHEEFENRARYPGYDPMDVFLSASPPQRGSDCFGHGTHVASLAAGKTFGSAKKATIYSVRVLDCQNRGPWTTVLDGLDYVARVISERNRPAIVSMSLGGGFTQSVNSAVQSLHSRGIIVVVAAGNDQADACQRSPASSRHAVTVGGTANGDGLYFATNYGPCVDIFAPGSRILAADHTCTTCTKFLSGTSMATPLVSGIAAVHLQQEPWISPDELKRRLTSESTKGALNFNTLPSAFRSTTPNQLLYITGSCGGNFSAARPTTIQSPNYPSNYSRHLHCTWTINAPPGFLVQLNFSDFSTELGIDTVKVCDGAYCVMDTVIAELSGELDARRLHYWSTKNTITVELSTDGILNQKGFQASYLMLAASTPGDRNSTIRNCTSRPSEPDQNVPAILQETIEEATTLLKEVIEDSLDDLLQSKLTGKAPAFPANSCREIAAERFGMESGYYWVKNSSGAAVRVFCDLTSQFQGNPTGWTRVVKLNMSSPTEQCPTGLKLITDPKRSCGRNIEVPGCSSVVFRVSGVPYRKVCGQIIGYQFSSPNAFYQYQLDSSLTLNDVYVDGVSLTHGSPTRKHIWTFAAAIDERASDRFICPCTHAQQSLPDTAIPPFIGSDYFCETGTQDTFEFNRFYSNDPLWDGNGCGPQSSCCSFNTPPWFCKDIGEKTTNDIEMRICGNEALTNEDTPVEIVELYVQ